MLAHDAAIHVNDVTRRRGAGTQLLHDVRILARWHEADVLAVRFRRDLQAQRRRRASHIGLRHAAERKAQEVELVARGGEQEVGLIAVRIGRAREVGLTLRVNGAADIVPCRHCVRAKIARCRQKVGELHGLVAAHAGDRRRAFQVGVREVFHNLLTKAAFVIQHVMRNAQRLGDAPRVVDVLTRTARTLFLQRCAMIVELQRHADHIIAGIFQQGCDDGRVHAAGHGGNNADLSARTRIAREQVEVRPRQVHIRQF